jgi:hypothetical protein
MAKKGMNKLAGEMSRAGVKPHDVRKMVAASKTAKQTSRIKKARRGLAKAKAARARFRRSPEGLLARASERRTRRKR